MRFRLVRGSSDDERGAKAVEARPWWELEGAYDVGLGVRDAC